MNHASLFTGIGGFDYAAELMGWNNVFQVEIDPFCQFVLSKRFPHAKRHTDIKEFTGKEYRNSIDILTGGFPCQPYSSAGKRRGTNDERHLWPHMLRVIHTVRPRYIVGENVFGLITWNDGLVFDEVQTDLESEGYQVQAYVLPACAVNAPHRRDRVWFVAYSNSNAVQSKVNKRQEHQLQGPTLWSILEADGHQRAIADTSSQRQQEQYIAPVASGKGITTRSAIENWREWPTESPVCSSDDGLSAGLDRTGFAKWCNNSLKAAGNAIVPPVALQIFKAIQLFDNGLTV